MKAIIILKTRFCRQKTKYANNVPSNPPIDVSTQKVAIACEIRGHEYIND